MLQIYLKIDICPWMPMKVQSLRKKFRDFSSKMSNLNTLRLDHVGLQLNSLLVKHNFCLCLTPHFSFFPSGLFLSF